jgi:excisionase family DNA binding protein
VGARKPSEATEAHLKDELVSYEEAARILGGVSLVTIWRLARAGQLEQVKIGSRTMFRRSDLDALVRTGTRIPTSSRQNAS